MGTAKWSAGFIELRNEIKANTKAAYALNAQIAATSGLDRHQVRLQKKLLGFEQRYLYLAYGFIYSLDHKGYPRYTTLEGRVREGNAPFPGKLLKTIQKYHRPTPTEGPVVTEEQLAAWLASTEPMKVPSPVPEADPVKAA